MVDTTYSYTPEPVPTQIMRNLLIANWIESKEIPKPFIIEANSETEPFARFDTRTGDGVIIRNDPTGVTIRLRSTYWYYDKNATLILELWSKESRQRLYDIYAMIRRIIFQNMHDTPNTKCQLLRVGTFTEINTQEMNVWHAQMRVTFEDWGKSINVVRTNY